MATDNALKGQLKLAFSTAADADRLQALYAPETADASDPNHFLAERLSDVFNRAVEEGCAAFLHDPSGVPKSVTIAYHLPDAEDATQHAHTEVGSTSSLIPGFKSSNLVVAALALREWLHHPPAEVIAAKIKPENIPSVKVYQEALGWQQIDDQGRHDALISASHKTMSNADDPLKGRKWYACEDETIVQQAKTVLGFMDQGGLTNKAGDFIPVDFSALDKEGLTRQRLEAIAGGATTRSKLPKISP